MITLLKLLFCVCIFWDILCMLLFSANFCNTFHFLDSNYIYIVYGWHMIIWIWIFHLFYVHVMTSSAPSSFKPTNICGIFKRFLSIGRINRKLMWLCCNSASLQFLWKCNCRNICFHSIIILPEQNFWERFPEFCQKRIFLPEQNFWETFPEFFQKSIFLPEQNYWERFPEFWQKQNYRERFPEFCQKRISSYRMFIE